MITKPRRLFAALAVATLSTAALAAPASAEGGNKRAHRREAS